MNRLPPEPPRAALKSAATSEYPTVDFGAGRRQQLRCGQRRGRRRIKIKSASRHRKRRKAVCVQR